MKNIILCCDGTGNQFNETYSNVVKLYTCLKKDSAVQLAFYDPGVGTMSDLFSILIHWNNKLTGRSTILSTLEVYPLMGLAGIISNRVIIKKLGVSLYVLTEHYVLHPEGKDVFVHSRERLGPVPFLFKRIKWHPAVILDEGKRANYLDMPILGTIWTGDYKVNVDETSIDSSLVCDWAEATELIDKVANGPAVNQNFFVYPKTIPEVIHCLERYRDWYDKRKDSQATFTHTYLRITELFERRIPVTGFHDRTWVTELVVAFANQYLKAIHEYDMGVVGGAWKHVFDTILKNRT